MEYREHRVMRGEYGIYAREYAGEGPAIIAMHGFPDNHHLYDRLVPYWVEAGRRVVVFDFLGWGRSDKPGDYPYTSYNQTWDLDAVIGHLGLEDVVLVAHDASGPPAIDWALWHPERVSSLVLLNTYYSFMPTLRMPEVIRLFSTPGARQVARFLISRMPERFRWAYRWQVGTTFMRDERTREEFLPLFYAQLETTPSSFPPLFSLTRDLRATVRSRAGAADRLAAFGRPVRVIFGAEDPYLNPGVARGFRDLFPESEMFLLPGVGHFPQLDDPGEVARLILSAPPSQVSTPDGRRRSVARRT